MAVDEVPDLFLVRDVPSLEAGTRVALGRTLLEDVRRVGTGGHNWGSKGCGESR